MKFKKLLSNWSFILFFTLLFVVWIFFFERYDYQEVSELDKKVKELEDQRDYYKQMIAADSAVIVGLSDSAYIEKFARENFLMKREEEKIYIVK